MKFVKQVEPTLVDLTERRTEVPHRSGDHPTGSWGAKTRDYHICAQVPAAAVGDRMLATQAGNTDTAGLLGKVVDIEDPHTGTVHLKRNVTAVDAMTLDTRSSKTLRVRKEGS
ncbi:hypothetical protein [Tsukamurella soli]|uniref:hypothetical protein n=1 Tax=Tsukamurella soli TaxID=644556 RepID=UPI0031EFA308